MSDQVRDMTTGSPSKLILLFAVPLMLGNVCQQLYTMVDTVIVGRCTGFGCPRCSRMDHVDGSWCIYRHYAGICDSYGSRLRSTKMA